MLQPSPHLRDVAVGDAAGGRGGGAHAAQLGVTRGGAACGVAGVRGWLSARLCGPVNVCGRLRPGACVAAMGATTPGRTRGMAG